MELEFECQCGERVSEFTRGDSMDLATRVGCEECGAMYAVTLTPLWSE